MRSAVAAGALFVTALGDAGDEGEEPTSRLGDDGELETDDESDDGEDGEELTGRLGDDSELGRSEGDDGEGGTLDGDEGEDAEELRSTLGDEGELEPTLEGDDGEDERLDGDDASVFSTGERKVPSNNFDVLSG